VIGMIFAGSVPRCCPLPAQPGLQGAGTLIARAATLAVSSGRTWCCGTFRRFGSPVESARARTMPPGQAARLIFTSTYRGSRRSKAGLRAGLPR
jgi:hypothetical protein